MAWWDPANMRRPGRPVPKLPAKPAAYVTGFQYYAKGVPASDQAIYVALAERFRAGDLYAYCYEGGRWSTWDCEHDWQHTERNGSFRCACPSTAAGPTDWARADLVDWLELTVPAKPARLTKAQLVARLRAMSDVLPPAALEVLSAA